MLEWDLSKNQNICEERVPVVLGVLTSPVLIQESIQSGRWCHQQWGALRRHVCFAAIDVLLQRTKQRSTRLTYSIPLYYIYFVASSFYSWSHYLFTFLFSCSKYRRGGEWYNIFHIVLPIFLPTNAVPVHVKVGQAGVLSTQQHGNGVWSVRDCIA